MNTIQKVAKNTSILLISQVITYILAFIFTMYSARYLGVENFGILSFALAFTGVTVLFTDLGLSTLLVREVSRNKDLMRTYIQNILSLKLILGLITFILSILIVKILGYNLEIIQIVAIITLYTIFSTLASSFYALFQTQQRLEYQSIGQILSSLLLLLGALFIIYNKIDILGFALLYLFVSIVIFVYSFIICKWKFIFPKMEINFDFWKILLKNAIPLSIILIFSSIAFRIDTVLLSILDTNLAVGIYSAAYKLIEVLTFFPAVFTASIYPIFSKFHVSSKDSLKNAYTKSFRYLSFIGLPIAVIMTLLADKIIFLVYGTQYIESITVLKIIIWAIPFTFLTYFSGTVMISINKQNVLVKIFFIAMIINVVLNIIFIPSFSYIAASIITIITEFIEVVLISYFLFKFICRIQIKDIIIKPIIASLVMGLFIFNINTNLFLQILIALCVYLVTLFILKTFTEEDIYLFKQIIAMIKK